MPAPQNRLVTLGRVVGAYGVRGWVKVRSYTRPEEDILNYHTWLIGEQEVRLVRGRAQGRGLVVKLAGYTDRDQASELVGADIAVPLGDLPPLGAGEFYWWQLEGLRVVNLEGRELGTVGYLLETGANDVLVVSGERERLIPYIKAVVKEIDLDGGLIRVDWDVDF